MSTDLITRRQYLGADERKAAAKLEAAWIAGLVTEAGPLIDIWLEGLGEKTEPRLADWQALSDHLTDLAGMESRCRVVWQPAMRDDRGQLLWRFEGSLLQLRRGAQASLAEWAGTVAQETCHHVQQELVCSVYRGSPALRAPHDALAVFYRDARNAYISRGPDFPPAVHRRQPLEVGAWAFGEAIARRVQAGSKSG
jgi:hypothetical protein